MSENNKYLEIIDVHTHRIKGMENIDIEFIKICPACREKNKPREFTLCRIGKSFRSNLDNAASALDRAQLKCGHCGNLFGFIDKEVVYIINKKEVKGMLHITLKTLPRRVRNVYPKIISYHPPRTLEISEVFFCLFC